MLCAHQATLSLGKAFQTLPPLVLTWLDLRTNCTKYAHQFIPSNLSVKKQKQLTLMPWIFPWQHLADPGERMPVCSTLQDKDKAEENPLDAWCNCEDSISQCSCWIKWSILEYPKLGKYLVNNPFTYISLFVQKKWWILTHSHYSQCVPFINDKKYSY